MHVLEVASVTTPSAPEAADAFPVNVGEAAAISFQSQPDAADILPTHLVEAAAINVTTNAADTERTILNEVATLDFVATTIAAADTGRLVLSEAATLNATINTAETNVARLSEAASASVVGGAAGIAFDAATDGNYNGGSGNLTFAHTVGSGDDRALVVGILGNNGADDITSVTYNGAALTFVTSYYTGFVLRRSSVWILLNPDSGTHNVVISIGSAQYLWGSAASYTGAAQSAQPNTFIAQANFNPLTATVTTTVNDCWLVMFEQGYPGSVTAYDGVERTRDFSSPYNTWWLGDTNASVGAAGSHGFTVTRTGSTNDFSVQILIALAPSSGITETARVGLSEVATVSASGATGAFSSAFSNAFG